MAEAALSPERGLEETGRKRSASGGLEDCSPDHKRRELEAVEAVDPLEDLLGLGHYPFNVKRTCVMHDHSSDPADPQGLNCQEFDWKTTYDEKVFIDQNEAEELLAPLEQLAGKLAQDTQPLPLGNITQCPEFSIITIRASYMEPL